MTVSLFFTFYGRSAIANPTRKPITAPTMTNIAILSSFLCLTWMLISLLCF